MVDRIRALLVLRQLTPTQFADLIQVGRPIVSHILSGRNKASLEVVQRIVAAFPEVALPWLLSGTGPMLASAEPAMAPKTTPKAPVIAELAPEQTVLTPPQAPPTPVLPNEGRAERKAASPVAVSALVATPPRQPARKFVQPVPVAGMPAVAETAASAPTNAGASATAAISAPVALDTAPPGPQARGTELPELPQQPVEQRPATTEPLAASAMAGGAAVAVPSDDVAVGGMFGGFHKPIRRIVLFYQDGSFADFRPE